MILYTSPRDLAKGLCRSTNITATKINLQDVHHAQKIQTLLKKKTQQKETC